ncbi:peroxisomal 2,4-dienoyl-CoA reductase-like protein SPS19 [Hortaea werneckii]|nr:peroxisomal 2,4-dienoyl-CoA reductase-like protein SPS19 [Hortaea werneckii]
MSVPREKYLSPVWRDGLFQNKVLFCTGGAGTICSMQVRAFVALGGNACVIGRNPQKTEQGAKDITAVRPGAKVIGIGNVDVRDPKMLKDAADRCAKELGGIDFAIAGAAGNFLAPMAQLSPNAFKSVMDIDALGSYNTAKAVLPYLVESAKRNPNSGKSGSAQGTGGRMIFVSATFHYRGQPLQAHVAAAKAAVDQISHSVAIEYGPYGITSNVITPGPISGTEGMERLSKSDEASVKATKKIVPLGRWGETREIADATTYLFSEAGSYVNGNTLVVDGGAWRTSGASQGKGWDYPDFILSGAAVEGVKGGKRDGSKL